MPADSRDALQWFVNNFGLYVGSARGLFLSDWDEEQAVSLEAAIINLKSRGFTPFIVSGETVYKQADYLYREATANTQFGRPLASKLELELTGAPLLIIDSLEAPENTRELWYLYNQVLYPRAVSGKPTIITTPLSHQEFVRYGDSCQDVDFCGKSLNWEKLIWVIEASMIPMELFKLAREESLPPMLKAEYHLYMALKERGLDPIPQHVLGDYLLDFAIIDKERRLNIECDVISALAGVEVQRQEAKCHLVLLSDGWQILKFSTTEILTNRAACAEATDEVWRSGRKRSSAGRHLTGTTVSTLPELPVDDEVQLAAITHGGGPAAIVGGAGTGKTTCLVQRVAYLLSHNVNPENILVVTHSPETLKPLKRAVDSTVEKQAAQRLNLFSWQDLGMKILKENLPAIRRKPPLKVEPNPQKIIQRILAKIKKEVDPAKLELSADLDEFYIGAVISMYKAHLISAKQAKDDAQGYAEEIIAKVYQGFEDQLQKANRIDRDDVISLAVQALLENPETRLRYQSQYEFVICDEYQEVTVAQDMLARILAAPQDNFCIAGDEDETVTEFKNACPELFTEISFRLPHARCYTLERNWRSHPAIVDHARNLLTGLTRRKINKDYMSAWGQAAAGAIMGPERLADQLQEAEWVANEIQILTDSGRGLGDIAVLYRHHVYSTILEEALERRGVRFLSSSQATAMVPDEVEDMLAFLKLVMDPDGPRARESFERICLLRVKEIDPKLSATIASFAEANNLSYLKALEIYSEATSDQSCGELNQVVRVIRTMNQDKLPPTEAISLIRRTQRLNEYYRSVKVPPGANYEPLKKLGQLEEESRTFKTVADFVKHMTAQKQGGGLDAVDPGVSVLNISDCKGQEFPVVFIVGMAEGIFPAEAVIDLEEERRICYVGFTRTKELLYISYPASFSGVPLAPSHFLVDARLIPAQAHHPEPMYVQPAQQMQAPTPQPIQQAPPQPVPQPIPQAPQPALQSVPQPIQQPLVQQPAPPQPIPQPAPVPQPAPIPQPIVQPQPVPQPAPVSQPAPIPQPAPTPQPVARPQPAPEPTPIPRPVVQPQPIPTPQRVEPNQPIRQPAAIEQPVPEPQPQHAPVIQPPSPQPAAPMPAAQPPAAQPIVPTPAPAQTAQPAQAPYQPAVQAPVEDMPPAQKRFMAKSRPQPIEEEPDTFTAAAAAAAAAKAEAEQSTALYQQAYQAMLTQQGLQPYVAGEAQAPHIMPSLPKSKNAAHQAAQPTASPTPSDPIESVRPTPSLPKRGHAIPESPAARLGNQPIPVAPEPYAAPVAEPYAAPVAEPYAAPVAEPYAAPVPEPYAVPTPVAHNIPAGDYSNPPEAIQQQPGMTESVMPTQAWEPQPTFAQTQPYAPYANAQAVPEPEAPAQFVSHLHPMCPSCQSPLEANSRFCGGCGYNLPERIPACPTCGAPLEISAKFCGECGTSLNAPLTHGSSLLTNNLNRMHDLKEKQQGWMVKLLKKLES